MAAAIRVLVRCAQSGVPVLGNIDQGMHIRRAPTLPRMNIDAALTFFSLAAFVMLFVTWILAPLRADGPTTEHVAEVVEPRTAVAA
jgi:hypothetical protein